MSTPTGVAAVFGDRAGRWAAGVESLIWRINGVYNCFFPVDVLIHVHRWCCRGRTESESRYSFLVLGQAEAGAWPGAWASRMLSLQAVSPICMSPRSMGLEQDTEEMTVPQRLDWWESRWKRSACDGWQGRRLV